MVELPLVTGLSLWWITQESFCELGGQLGEVRSGGTLEASLKFDV